MEQTDKNLKLVGHKVADYLSCKKGFPENQRTLFLYAKFICKIVWNKSQDEIVTTLRPDLSGASIQGGIPNDLDWLMEELFENHQYFPEPSLVRDVYEGVFTSWDRRATFGVD